MMTKTTEQTDQATVLFRRFILKVASLKYIYIAFIIIFSTGAFLKNKFSNRVYQVKASISPVQNDPSAVLGSNDHFRGIDAFEQTKNIENEINNIKSFELVYATITKMKLEVSCYREKKKVIKQTVELYKNSPFQVNIDKSHIQPIDASIYVKILSDSTFKLTAAEKKVSLYNYVDNAIVSWDNVLKIDTICKFNVTISNDAYKFSISLNKDNLPDIDHPESLYFFRFNHLDYLSKLFLSKLDAERITPLASIITVQFSGESKEMTINFLNKFLESYLDHNLVKKNKMAISTINFIDSQISEISDSLVLSESKLRNFKSANQVMDVSFQAQRKYEEMTQIQTARSNLEVQQRYYNYVINYFRTNKDMSAIFPPSAMNVSDPIMTQLITELLSLNAQRSAISSNNNEKNLFIGQIENKIKTQKQAILENVTNNLNTLNLSLNELNYRADKLSKEISKLPKTELNMVSMQRKFNLNGAMYTFLLQKRSEAAITLASNYPDYEIMEPAREVTARIVSPNIKLNYLLALFIALLIPSLYIFIIDFFNTKISSLYDLEHLINRSILGIIYNNQYKSEIVVVEYPKSAISESFRNIRSILFMKLKPEPFKVILVTSSQPQEGKSFISFNLAASIASVGYKTIIIDGDLRRPTMHNKFKLDNSLGITNYMDRRSSINNIIKSTFLDNLSFIPAGPLMPNPTEFIESGALDELFISLKKEYEYIIIDSTPVGLVADATMMMKYASQVLLICRHNNTRKDVFSNVLTNLELNKITNFDLIYNDLSLEKSPYRHFGKYYSSKKSYFKVL
jgi:tyrosine-protein kinase Etk/Wzc